MSSARRVELDGEVVVALSLDDLALLASAAGRWNELRAGTELGLHRRLARVRDEALAAVDSESCPPVAGRVLPAPHTERVMVDPATAAAAWGVTPREVTRRCNEGRIPGAIKLGSGRSGRWALPLLPTTNDDNGVNLP